MPRIVERTVFEFEELSEKAKARAREHYLSHGLSDGWWYSVYEDAIATAAILGITIDNHTDTRRGNGRGPKIYFSGFSSQGDGASFEGSYRPVKGDIVAAIKAHAPEDKALHTIAENLALLQVTARLTDSFPLMALGIASEGHYCHSGSMVAKFEYDGKTDDLPSEDQADKLLRHLREFADWIYEQLEAENDYLCSDEYVDESLADDEFDEDGAIV